MPYLPVQCDSLQASWDWYTAEVRDCKTPRDALEYSMRCVDWGAEQRLYGTLANACLSFEKLEHMEALIPAQCQS